MATGKSLIMREIRPTLKFSGPTEGFGYRHPERKAARAALTTPRRLKRAAKRARRA